MTVKNLNYVEIDSVNLFYLIIDITNGCNEESNGNKYLTLAPTDESRGTLKSVKNY